MTFFNAILKNKITIKIHDEQNIKILNKDRISNLPSHIQVLGKRKNQ